jgi:hypothetical protein
VNEQAVAHVGLKLIKIKKRVMNLKQQGGREWTGFICLRIGTASGLL